jgi:hypothetical protein
MPTFYDFEVRVRRRCQRLQCPIDRYELRSNLDVSASNLFQFGVTGAPMVVDIHLRGRVGVAGSIARRGNRLGWHDGGAPCSCRLSIFGTFHDTPSSLPRTCHRVVDAQTVRIRGRLRRTLRSCKPGVARAQGSSGFRLFICRVRPFRTPNGTRRVRSPYRALAELPGRILASIRPCPIVGASFPRRTP